jgi:serine/threonine protein kinase
VGNYEVLQKIGSGTEATVFTVRDMRDGSTKVLKALNPGRSRGRNSPSFVHGVCIERE